MRTDRLEAFSDGVLAIIITVMVLELRQPAGTSISALWNTTGTGLLSYLLSFVYVGIYWTNHHHMFQLTKRVNGAILWANLDLLFWLSLFPFTTNWMDNSHYARVPTIVYGLNLLVAGLGYLVLQSAIIRSQGRDSKLRTAIGRDFKGRVSTVCYILGAVAALLGAGTGSGPGRPGIWVAVGFYVAAAALWIIPDRRIEAAVAFGPGPSPAPDPQQNPDPDSDPDSDPDRGRSLTGP